jgi:hypothetical protein
MQENIRKEVIIVPNNYLESYTIGHLAREGFTLHIDNPSKGLTTLTR